MFMILGVHMVVLGISLALYDKFRQHELSHLNIEEKKSIVDTTDEEFEEYLNSH